MARRRRHGKDRRAVRIVAALGLAVLGHAGLLAVAESAGWLAPKQLQQLMPVDEAQAAQDGLDPPIEIDSLLEALEAPQAETAAEKEKKKEEAQQKPEGQVVEIARPLIEQRPDDARFLAEHDVKVQKETKGPTGKSAALGAAQTPPTPPPLPSGTPRPQVVQGAIGQRLPAPKGGATAEELAQLGPDGESPMRQGEGPLQPGERAGGALPPGTQKPNLTLSPRELAKVLGIGGGTPDHLEDVDDGDSTSLGAKKWKFAAFFNRIKQSVREEWHPDELLSRHDPQGQVYGAVDRTTVLRVRLRTTGAIDDVEVISSCGVAFLDEEAMAAFRRAQPFENPPQGLADADGLIRFRFGFVVNLSGRTSFKFYKY